MTLLGAGVLVFSLAFAVLVGYLAKTLMALTKVIDSVGDTVGQLPDQLDNVFKETGNVIHESSRTLSDVNDKMQTLNPFFEVVEDMGESAHRFSSSLAERQEAKQQAGTGRSKREFVRSIFKRSK